MDRQTVFTKTAKGLMEATGKTSVLSRDMRTLLQEIDGKAAVGAVHAKLVKVPEDKLLAALQALVKNGFIQEFKQTAPAAPKPKVTEVDIDLDLDFTMAIPTLAELNKRAEEEARQKAQAEAEAAAQVKAEAETRAKAEAQAKARAAAEAAAARARAEAESRAKAEALEKARREAEAKRMAHEEAERKAKEETERKAKEEAERKAKEEAERKAKEEAERKAKEDAERKAKEDAERKAKEEAERKAKEDAERKAKEEAERRAREEFERERKEAEESARREADELRAKLDEERKERELAERNAKEQAERERKEIEEKARREADELRAKLEEERKEREQAERNAKEQAERERKQAEEKAQREADELRAKLDEERRAREEAERNAKEQEERRAREDAERQSKEEADRARAQELERERIEAEEKARGEAEEQARKDEDERAKAREQERVEAEARASREAEQAEHRAREDAERQEKKKSEREQAERERSEAAEKARREIEEQARKDEAERASLLERERAEAEAQARREAESQEVREAEERSRKDEEDKAGAAAEKQSQHEATAQDRAPAVSKPGRSLDDLVRIEVDFDALSAATPVVKPKDATPSASADDKMLMEVEEKARAEAAEKARSEAEQQARKQAEDEAKRAEEEAALKQETERSPGRASALGLPDPREHVKAETQMRAQNAETERHFADMEKELDAERATAAGHEPPSESPRDARRRERDEAKERTRAAASALATETDTKVEAQSTPYRTPVNWGRPAALGLFLLLVLGLVSIHFVSFDGYIPQFEKVVGGHLQQPVKIKALRLSLVPQPHWRMDGVAIGSEGQLSVEKVKAIAELGSMFSDKKVFKSIELESPVLGEDGLLGLLFGKPSGQDFKVASVLVTNGKLISKSIILPVLDAKIAIDDNGLWKQIALETPDRKTSLLLKPDSEGASIEIETNVFSLPIDPSFLLENFSAKGVIRRSELRFTELKGAIYGGFLSGTASLKWGADWSLGGTIDVRSMEPGRFAPALLEEGKLEGKGVYAMRAKSYDELFSVPRLEGSFTIQKGTVIGVDLGRLLQGGGVGGKTAFGELTGSFLREAGKTQFRQIRLGAGPVLASGSADIDTAKRLSGRFAVEIKSAVAQARVNLTVSGTSREPRFSR